MREDSGVRRHFKLGTRLCILRRHQSNGEGQGLSGGSEEAEFHVLRARHTRSGKRSNLARSYQCLASIVQPSSIDENARHIVVVLSVGKPGSFLVFVSFSLCSRGPGRRYRCECYASNVFEYQHDGKQRLKSRDLASALNSDNDNCTPP